MRLVGRVIRLYGTRTMVVRCNAAQLPRLYAEVIDRRMKPVGRLVDVFGNISAPYAAIKCYEPCSVPVGEKVFEK